MNMDPSTALFHLRQLQKLCQAAQVVEIGAPGHGWTVNAKAVVVIAEAEVALDMLLAEVEKLRFAVNQAHGLLEIQKHNTVPDVSKRKAVPTPLDKALEVLTEVVIR
jgi:hypothetical protein